MMSSPDNNPHPGQHARNIFGTALSTNQAAEYYTMCLARHDALSLSSAEKYVSFGGMMCGSFNVHYPTNWISDASGYFQRS